MSDTNLRRTVECVVTALSRLGVRFHVTGGLASSYYGEPRLTQDVDFVVRLTPDDSKRLVEALEKEFLIELRTVEEAVQRRGMFQALHRSLLIKADFHVGEKIEGELERSVVSPLFEGLDIPLVSKEDAILSKLIWAREGSDKSRRDILGMLLDPTPFDLETVRRRAADLQCSEILSELEREARSF